MKSNQPYYHFEDIQNIIFEPEIGYATPQSALDFLHHHSTKASSIKKFQDQFGLTQAQMAPLLHVSEPTLGRWILANKPLDAFTAVKLFELLKFFQYGISFMGNGFSKWLYSPNTALGGLKPSAVLSLPEGVSQVRQLIGRIEHGVYS